MAGGRGDRRPGVAPQAGPMPADRGPDDPGSTNRKDRDGTQDREPLDAEGADAAAPVPLHDHARRGGASRPVPRERPGRRGRGRDRGHRFGQPLGGDRRVVRGARPARGVEGRLRRPAQHRHRRGDRATGSWSSTPTRSWSTGPRCATCSTTSRWRATASARSTSSARSGGSRASSTRRSGSSATGRPTGTAGPCTSRSWAPSTPRAAAARASSGSRSTTTATSSRPAGRRRRPTATWRS